MNIATEKLTVADQIRRDAALRQASGDALPAQTRRPLVFNEDALMVHPDQVFLNPNNSRRSFNEEKIEELAASASTRRRRAFAAGYRAAPQNRARRDGAI